MSNSVEFTRKIYDEAINWYKSAENKAQILLGILGTFTGILTALVMGKPTEVRDLVHNLDSVVVICMSLALIAIFYGVFACYNCLRSRLSDKLMTKGLNKPGLYTDARLLFFGFHAKHDPEKLADSLMSITDESDEIKIYAYQIVALSKNVTEKHKWVNQAFLSISIGIFLMLVTTVIYFSNLSRN